MDLIGLTIRRLRQDREMSQKDLAGLVDTTGTSIGRMENGAQPVRLPMVKRLLKAFDITMDEWEAELERSQKTSSNSLALYPEVQGLLLLESQVFQGPQVVANAAVWLFSQSSAEDKLKAVAAATRIASGAASLTGLAHIPADDPPAARGRPRKKR